MREPEMALILKECLEAMEDGAVVETVDSERASEIQPLVDLAAQVRSTRDSYVPPVEFFRALGDRLRLAAV